jgi:hypothetical protein
MNMISLGFVKISRETRHSAIKSARNALRGCDFERRKQSFSQLPRILVLGLVVQRGSATEIGIGEKVTSRRVF